MIFFYNLLLRFIYLDVLVETLAKLTLILLLDFGQVNFRAAHQYSGQDFAFVTRAL